MTWLRPKWAYLVGIVVVIDGAAVLMLRQIVRGRLDAPASATRGVSLDSLLLGTIALIMLLWSASYLVEACGVSYDADSLQVRTLLGSKRMRWADVTRARIDFGELELWAGKTQLRVKLGILKSPELLLETASLQLAPDVWKVRS